MAARRDWLKARMPLHDLFGGEIQLVPDDQGELVAHWNLHTSALLRGVGTNGSGGGLSTNSTVVVPFPNIDRRRRTAPPAMPSHCGNGHQLTGGNISTSGGRWRCRRCGAKRASRFRMPKAG